MKLNQLLKEEKFMGLTYKRQDQLEKMLDRFAIVPKDPKSNGKNSKKKLEKDATDKTSSQK